MSLDGIKRRVERHAYIAYIYYCLTKGLILNNRVVIALALALVACILLWPDSENSQPAAPKTAETPNQQKNAPFIPRSADRANPPVYRQGESYRNDFRSYNAGALRQGESAPYAYSEHQRQNTHAQPGYQNPRDRYDKPFPRFGEQNSRRAAPGLNYGNANSPYANSYGYSRGPIYKFRPLDSEQKEKEQQPGRYQNYPQLPLYQEPSLTPNTPSYGTPPIEPWDMPRYPGSNFEFPQTSNQQLFSIR